MRTWEEIKRWRKAKRDELIGRRLAAGAERRRHWDARIEPALRALLADVGGRTIGFYWPFKGEFEVRPLIRALIEAGARAALPVVTERAKPMEYRRWAPGAEMVPGVWKIPVPKRRDLVQPAIVLVPLVGFDTANYRLGYGMGYFDRTLAALAPKPYAVGVGYGLGRLDTIYPQPHDIPMDVIVTEEGAHPADRAAGALSASPHRDAGAAPAAASDGEA